MPGGGSVLTCTSAAAGRLPAARTVSAAQSCAARSLVGCKAFEKCIRYQVDVLILVIQVHGKELQEIVTDQTIGVLAFEGMIAGALKYQPLVEGHATQPQVLDLRRHGFDQPAHT